MTVRNYKPEDLPILQEMHRRSGFTYPFPDLEKLEAFQVVTDEDDKPIMAAGAEKILQLYLFCGQEDHPATRLHAMRLLHKALGKLLSSNYTEANAFLPPEIAEKFGRRLEKTFGWVRNWSSWCIAIKKEN
jgi:hypothetical protein